MQLLGDSRAAFWKFVQDTFCNQEQYERFYKAKGLKRDGFCEDFIKKYHCNFMMNPRTRCIMRNSQL